MTESPYLERIRDECLNPQHLQELEILGAMVRKGDRSWSDFSWGGELTKERYRQLRERYPEAHEAFGSELWEEKGRDQSKIRTRRNLVRSPYIEQMARELSDFEEKALRRFKDAMIDTRLGYGSQAMSYLLVDWKNRHPESYEAFKEELRLRSVRPRNLLTQCQRVGVSEKVTHNNSSYVADNSSVGYWCPRHTGRGFVGFIRRGYC